MLHAAGLTILLAAAPIQAAPAPCQTEAEVETLARDSGLPVLMRLAGDEAARLFAVLRGPEADTMLVIGLPGGERVILVALLRGCTVATAAVPASLLPRLRTPEGSK